MCEIISNVNWNNLFLMISPLHEPPLQVSFTPIPKIGIWSIWSVFCVIYQAVSLIYWCHCIFQAPPPLMGAPPPPPPPPPPGPPPPSSWVKDKKECGLQQTTSQKSMILGFDAQSWGIIIFNVHLSSFCSWFQCGSQRGIPYSDSFHEWFDLLCCLQRNDARKYQFYVKAVKYLR